ncbi:MAG: hypothetical protein Q9199_005546 [Rusavskia elegans]
MSTLGQTRFSTMSIPDRKHASTTSARTQKRTLMLSTTVEKAEVLRLSLLTPEETVISVRSKELHQQPPPTDKVPDGAIIEDFGHSWPRLESLIPRPCLRVILLPLIDELSSHEVWWVDESPMPRLESEIGVGALITNKVRLAGYLELSVDDAEDTSDSIGV